MRKTSRQKIMDVEIDKIDEPKAIIRMDIDQEEIEDLAVSISEIGLLQPILISVNNDRYETVFGHRRLLAHKHLGLAKIKSIVKQMSQKEIGIARATENIARADLTPIEEAATYKNLIEEYGMKIEHVAKKMGKRPATIKRRMDLLRMPPALQKAVHSKDITMTVAEELWAIRDQTQLEYYLIFAVENGATKEVARGWAQDWKDTVRRESSPGVEGGRVPLSPFEPRPIFVACDICVQPVELGKDKLMRLCPNCFKTIKEGMEVKK